MTEVHSEDYEVQEIYDVDPEVGKTAAEVADEDADLDYLLAKPRGRRWLYRLAHDDCHCSSLSLVPGDSEATAFNEGSRAIGVALLEDVRRRSPTAYMKMLEENAFND